LHCLSNLHVPHSLLDWIHTLLAVFHLFLTKIYLLPNYASLSLVLDRFPILHSPSSPLCNVSSDVSDVSGWFIKSFFKFCTCISNDNKFIRRPPRRVQTCLKKSPNPDRYQLIRDFNRSENNLMAINLLLPFRADRPMSKRVAPFNYY
jgi:hypothetical protein